MECLCTFSLKIFGFEAFIAISVDSSRNQVFAEHWTNQIWFRWYREMSGTHSSRISRGNRVKKRKLRTQTQYSELRTTQQNALNEPNVFLLVSRNVWSMFYSNLLEVARPDKYLTTFVSSHKPRREHVFHFPVLIKKTRKPL